MCNIAGYIGNRDAAPILMQMIAEQSGFCGGYYTGITTYHNGKLYTAKVLGDVDLLKQTTDALSLPGHIGIIHSRSNAGGDGRWAQPFLSNDERLSLCLNGSIGKYKSSTSEALFRFALESGARLESLSCLKVGKYAPLENGMYAHPSEAVSHTMRAYIEKGEAPDAAMAKAFRLYPIEMVGLSLSLDAPNAILFANYNMPMKIAYAQNEIFLCSFDICLPSDRSYTAKRDLSPLSYGMIDLRCLLLSPLPSPLKMTKTDAGFRIDAKNRILSLLNTPGAEYSTFRLIEETQSLYRAREDYENTLDLRYTVTYDILTELYHAGIIEIVREAADGAPEGKAQGIKTTKFLFKRKKEG